MLDGSGVPGRTEIDETQELNYRFIAQAIVDTGYTGFIAHEHKPSMVSPIFYTAVPQYRHMRLSHCDNRAPDSRPAIFQRRIRAASRRSALPGSGCSRSV